MDNTKNSKNYTTEQSDFKKNLNLLLSKWFWFPVSIISALIIAKTYNDLQTPLYKVNCKIVIGDDLNEPLSTSEIIGVNSGIDFNRMNPINKEIGIINSRKLAEETIESLRLNYDCYELYKGGRHFRKRLYNNIPFIIDIDSNNSFEPGREIILEILDNNAIEVFLNSNYNIKRNIQAGEYFTYGNFSFKIDLADNIQNLDAFIGKRYSITFKSKYSLAKEYSNKLKIDIDPKSQNILTLSLIDENINQSIAYLNKLCELYIDNDIQIRNTMASKTIEYIDNQLGILTRQLNDAEDRLINFNKKFNVIVTSENSILIQNYMEINTEIENTSFDNELLKRLLTTIDSVKIAKNTVLPEISEIDQKFRQLIENINLLIIDREILLKNQSLNSPEVKLNNQQLDVSLNKLIEIIKLEQRLVKERRDDLKKQIDKIEKNLIGIPEIQRKKVAFEREFKLTENLYNTYQQKRIEAILAKESTVSKIRVLDLSRYEDHQMVSPRKKYNYRIAFAFSLFLPALLIFLIKNLSDKIEDINEIKSKTNSIILGKIFHAEHTNGLPVVNEKTSPISESFYKLYARLKYLNPEPGIKTILITSGASGDGKTFCTANLAASIALSGKKVILINLDLRKPKIHEIFNTKMSPGLTNFLLGKSEKSEVIRSTDIENLDIISSGPIPPDPIKLINQNRIPELFSDLSGIYDYVIIDTPPVGIVADALLIGKHSDLQIFLIRAKFSRKSIYELLNELNESENFKNMAIVVNDIKAANGYGNRQYHNYYYTSNEKRSKWNKIKKFKLS